jgi:hypothetical protein
MAKAGRKQRGKEGGEQQGNKFLHEILRGKVLGAEL